ncbi:MAG: outer membrane lipoprotein LolB [Psychromonas sp.]|jgi:outer membrane lipoprotein LolB|uniref:lipoprotein insertase outer membrane protein LolB n=1 Tax=Psychromonas sp. TaxID=1884585 RepID=UPI0039E30DFA
MKKTLLLLLFTLGLVGCAQIPTAQHVNWQTQQQQLENLNEWTLTGKLAYFTSELRFSRNLFWQQSGEEFQITLTNFLGLTTLDVIKDQSGTKIIFDGKTYYGNDPEILIEKLSGFVIPIAALQQWIKGNPNHASYQLDGNNQVISLSSSDPHNVQWTVDYGDYKAIQGINLPHKLQLKQQDLRIKFSISKWQITPIKE